MASSETLRVGFLLAALLYAFDARADTTNCASDKGTVAYAQCVNSVLTELQKKLDQTYRLALENIPKLSSSDVLDPRKTTERLRQHLVQAQDAWEIYANESCAYIGAIQGRGLWIGIFEEECQIREKRIRIDALQRLPGPP
jgi:uncharacterized protein YecT (DUF1311 family)